MNVCDRCTKVSKGCLVGRLLLSIFIATIQNIELFLYISKNISNTYQAQVNRKPISFSIEPPMNHYDSQYHTILITR